MARLIRTPAPLVLLSKPITWAWKKHRNTKTEEIPQDAVQPTTYTEQLGRWKYRNRRALAAVPTAAALAAAHLLILVAPTLIDTITVITTIAAAMCWIRATHIGRPRTAAIATTITALLWLLSPGNIHLPAHDISVLSGGIFFAGCIGVFATWPQLHTKPWIPAIPALASITLAASIQVIGESGTIHTIPIGYTLHYFVPFIPSEIGRWIILAVGTTLITGLRIRRFRTRPVEIIAPDRSNPVHMWDDHIGGEGCKLAGSHLQSFTRTSDNTWTATVICPRGKGGFGTEEVQQAKNTIAGTFAINPDWIEIQPQNDYSAPRIIVTVKATLATSKPWKPGGLDLDTGRVEIGTYPDGSRSTFQLFVKGQGIRHFWATGGTGSGKSGCVSAYLGRIMQHGIVVLDLTDLGETSLPAWVPQAFRFGTTVEDGLLALKRAKAVMEARAAHMQTMPVIGRDGTPEFDKNGQPMTGISTLPVTTEWPIYLILIEEFVDMHQSKEAMTIIDEIGRKGRKYGVAVGVVTQPSDLTGAFKGCNGLRKNIQQGNIMGLRSDKEAASMTFGGSLHVSMGTIPAGSPGLGYVLSPSSMRDVMSRVDWVDDNPERPADVPSSWEVAAHAIPATLNPIDLEAIENVERQASETKTAKTSQGNTGLDRVVTREAVEAATRTAFEAAGGPVMLAKIAQLLAVDETDEVAKKRHTDRVRKHLDTLVKDDDSPVVKPDYGYYGIAV